MHELSIAQSLINVAKDVFPPDSGGKITALSVQVGEMSDIKIDALEFAFSAIKAGTLLCDAELHIEIVQGEAECQECQTIFPVHSYVASCPSCKSYHLKILKGRDLNITGLTIDE
jgi:hydrogenase nickel incorporation protein HypA/HybF